MNTEKKEFKKHLFICTNTRSDGSGCGPKGAELMAKELKGFVKSEKLEGVKVTRSGCLGLCEQAVAGVCYPEKLWITNATESDLDQLKEMLKS